MSRNQLWWGALLCATGGLGCDAFVGGACQTGYVEDGGHCVPEPQVTQDGSGGEFQPSTSSTGNGGSTGSQTGTTSTSSSASGGNTCEPPLVACPDKCADLQTDFDNCGACGVHCPTELCIDGACVGDPVGHLVTIGMSYTESHTSSRRVLGNAVFRTLHNPTRIVEYREHALPNTVAQIHGIVASEASQRNRAYVLQNATAGALADILGSGYYDVLLVHDQAAAPPGALGAIGSELAPAIADFAAAGGTIVTTATGAGTGEMCDLLTNAGILACTGFGSAMDGMIHNKMPGDVVGNGVVGPFVPKALTATILTTTPGAQVFTNDDDAPVVIHEVTL